MCMCESECVCVRVRMHAVMFHKIAFIGQFKKEFGLYIYEIEIWNKAKKKEKKKENR